MRARFGGWLPCLWAALLAGCGGNVTPTQASDGSTEATTPDSGGRDAAPDATVLADGGGDGAPTDAEMDGAADVVTPQDSAPEASPSQVVLTPDSGLERDPSCSGMPPESFGYEAGSETCFMVTADAGSSAEVCIPGSIVMMNSGGFSDSISGCTEAAVGAPCSYIRHGAFCCTLLYEPLLGPYYNEPQCAPLGPFLLVAYGNIVDTDQDLIPDLDDNCPMVPNTFQVDVDKDGIGDVCDDCPYTYNPDQASMADGGIGDACNCALAGVVLGPNGCPCPDGGAGSSVDAGDVCGLVITVDGLAPADGG